MNGRGIMLKDLQNIKSGEKELREFGLTVGLILLALGAIALLRHKGVYPYFLVIGALLTAFGAFYPAPLKPFQKVWMGFAVIAGFFMSRIILTILFFCVITPFGLVARMFSKDMLDERIDKTAMSYWRSKEDGEKAPASYENQY